MRKPFLTATTVSLLALAIAVQRAPGSDPPTSSQPNKLVWAQFRGAKRVQVQSVLSLYFPTYRPGAVGQTYLDLAGALDEIDVSTCHPALKNHVRKASRTC